MNATERLRARIRAEAKKTGQVSGPFSFSPGLRSSALGHHAAPWTASSAQTRSDEAYREPPAKVKLRPNFLPQRNASGAFNERKRAQTLKALRLARVEHALLCVPSGYIDGREAYVRTKNVPDGERANFLLRSSGHMRVYDKNGEEISCYPYGSWLEVPWRGYWSRFRRASIEFVDQDGQKLFCTVFAPAQAKRMAQAGEYLLSAELATFRARFLQKAQDLPVGAIGRVYALYTSPGASTSDEGVRDLVHAALAAPEAAALCIEQLREETLMDEQDMLSVVRSVQGCEHVESMASFLIRLHKPESVKEGEALKAAARRLAVIGLVHAARVQAWRAPSPQSRLDIPRASVDALIAQLPVVLTDDQKNAISAICSAMRAQAPMNALLCGDVGSGKTLAFAVPAVAAHLMGARVAIIAPTEILADQLAARLREFFPQAAVARVRAGASSVDEKALLVGTIGLGSVAEKLGYRPNLLIVDEQHKMAISARRQMADDHTHILEASATPIPHALASTLYAGVQMITLRQIPVRRNIVSVIAGDAQRTDVSRRVRETLDGGARVAIIYPRVSSQESANVENAAARLERVFPGKIACVHGKLKDEQIQAELDAFRSAEKPLLVASSIVETGIDVPDIRLLIVREADRFGIAQLHQMRGRLARNGGEGTFVMWVDDPKQLQETTLARLQAVERSNDGFALAEEDMRIRGFGDLLGDQQNGAISLPMRMLRLNADDVERELSEYGKFFRPQQEAQEATQAA